MLIFCDTNIFYNNWHLKNAQWGLLSNFIHNTSARLIVSELVCEEVQNIQEKESLSAIDAIRAEINKLNKLNAEKAEFDPRALLQTYTFKTILEDRFGEIAYFSYDMIPQKEVVGRAIKRVRPFQDEDKGYRDTLIWLSLLNYLQTIQYQGQLIFINANSNDFYNGGRGFHADLQRDITQSRVTCTFSIFISLYDFLNKHVVPEEHAVNYEEFYQQYLNTNDRLVQEAVIDNLTYMPHEQFRELFNEEHGPNPELAYSIEHEFEILEGIEDPELIACKKIAGNQFYVNYSFNLRICVISFIIPETEFEKYKLEISKKYELTEMVDHGVKITGFYRIDFITSFNLDIDNEDIDGLSIDYFRVRSRRSTSKSAY